VRPDLAHDCLCQFTLHYQDILKVAVVRFGPQVNIGLTLNQLGGDLDAITGALHGPFDHRVYVQVARNLRQALVRAFVVHNRSPRDHVKGLDLGQIGDECLGHALGEVVLVGVVGKIGKRQDGQ